ncbi:hypothetical protein [Sphingomonas sp.]|uniref:hypothetical protein n=1 Tax=Sphingomonas sp. TaxID=28214 RepID=UPI0033411766
MVKWQTDWPLLASSRGSNSTQIIALATIIASLVPLAPVSAQASVASSRSAETAKSGRHCDAQADCSGLSINETRALFANDADADTADSAFTSRRFVTVNVARASQRYLLALTGETFGTLGPHYHANFSLKLGSLSVNMDSDNAFPEHDPMASADFVLSVHRKF